MVVGNTVSPKPWDEILESCERCANWHWAHKDVDLMILKRHWKQDYLKDFTINEFDDDGTFSSDAPSKNYYHPDWVQLVK